MNLEDSPLKEVEKESLAELFARDPLQLTKTDVESICKELRARRSQWQQDEQRTRNKDKKVALSQSEMDELLNSI